MGVAYVLKMARAKVPYGSLQLAVFLMLVGIKELTFGDEVQGALEPPRIGLVKTATAMKAPMNKTSNTMKSQRRMFGPPAFRPKLKAVTIKVYRIAAARMPSTAPLELEALPARRTILASRTEKRIRDVSELRNWSRRSME